MNLLRSLPALSALFAVVALAGAPSSLVLEPPAGVAANGKHVVLLSGDEEYRSEEALPMLAKLLSARHGFKTTVLFALDPDGTINPTNTTSLAGAEALDTADVIIMALRFRAWTDDAMAHFVAAQNRGVPIIALRTSTHAFNFPAGSKWSAYTWNSRAPFLGGFGKHVLGETWVSHWGHHKFEATRSMVEPGAADNPLLRGVDPIFCTTDVYEAAPPADARVLLRGLVLQGMKPTDAPATHRKSTAGKVDQAVNDPAMPLVWTRLVTTESGAKAKIFTTTMGAATDFLDESLRRLIVNATYWAADLPVPARADVATFDHYAPRPYGFAGHRTGITPADHALGRELPVGGTMTAPPKPPLIPPSPTAPSVKTSPLAPTAQPSSAAAIPASGNAQVQAIQAAPVLAADAEDPAAENAKKHVGADRSEKTVAAPHAFTAEPVAASAHRPQAVAPPSRGEHIVLIGNGLAERDVHYHRIETELALRYPEHELFFRNLGHVGDTPGFRPHPSRASQWAFPGAAKFHPELNVHKGQGFFPTPDQWLTHLQADTIIAFFGYNESFDGPTKVANFEAELEAWVKHTLSKAYNGQAAPRLVIVSPVAYENQSALRDLPDGTKENANLQLYADAIASVAKKHGLTFIDLFNPMRELYALARQPLTTGGFIPTDEGYQHLAKLLADGAFGPQAIVSKADPVLVYGAVKQKDYFWNNDYNLVNGVHAYGRRYAPYGPQNYPDEIQKTREMTALRDAVIHAVASGRKQDLTVDDSQTHVLPPVPTNYQRSIKNGTEYLPADECVAALKVPEGYHVELFASEKEFPNLANPMQMSFDNRGRLWVAAMPAYPAYRPGDALPNDKLLIYEDTDGDGKADKETVFADHLYLPIGFEFAPEGVYLSQEPNFVLLRDTDGDDKADRTEIILGGFDTHDTHHAISAYAADPSGAFMLCEGVFLHSNVETPYGPVRCVDGGFFRYSPQRGMLERTIQMTIPNPWGYTFDRWGQDFFIHTSGTPLNWSLPMQVKPTFGRKTPATLDLVPPGEKVRPTSGLEVISSRHFPDEVQGDLLLCNVIGFLGIKQHQIQDDGTGWKTTFRQNLLTSTDLNFRPVDLEFAPDGSLYVIDWHNMLIGHMQHNARDPNRDHNHGRIYRITYPSRPLVKPPQVAGASLDTLLNNLKEPESRTRYRSRRELRSLPVSTVLPAVKKWAAAQTDIHAKLEALWVTWGMNAVDEPLLREILASSDFHARAAAVRVLRYNTHRITDYAALLEKAAADEHGRVRLEAVVAASWLPDELTGQKIVAVAASQPLDAWSKKVVKTAADRLAGLVETEDPEQPETAAPAGLAAAGREQFLLGQTIFHREGHCVTCHQADGKGLPGAFPPIAGSPWITGEAQRLIKLTLYGLTGPLEVNGKKFDGQVPMTPFGGMLSDTEVAAVLTYVRNSFGNQAAPISPEDVRKVRAAQPGRLMLYDAGELLREHPMN